MSLILNNVTDREIDLLEANNVDWLPTDDYKKDKSIIFMNENDIVYIFLSIISCKA